MNYILLPHLPQKDLPGFMLFPQFGHVIVTFEVSISVESKFLSLVPQYLQNFFVLLFSFPHETQIMVFVDSLVTTDSVNILSDDIVSSVVSSEIVL